jgi:hypothetical protein
VVEQRAQVVGVELEPGEQVEHVLRAEVLVRGVESAAVAVQRRQVTHLELHGVGPGRGGRLHELASEFHAAVVVDADLGDHPHRVVRADRSVPHPERGVVTVGDGDEPAAVVEQRHLLDPPRERCRDLLAGGTGRHPGEVRVRSLQHRTLQVDRVHLEQPSTHVPVGEHPLEHPGLVDAEEDPPLVPTQLGERVGHRVLGEDDQVRDAALDLHAGHPRHPDLPARPVTTM